ncbi:metalloregulator ArsR/SmtB family transcription factor [Alkalihalobacillus sp. MEB130]|uniref:ArsR/SmtB family transcription factor n=1 Tax=Alkalihalobacillus sp. MEB130 TaxID=2976704 RepID=UPI0028DD9296|nr:metalloregulator ArsR/SmtB family transcription factor [Alkalihalobacillus sp. MEB130]MDT8859546.1 metalloregulator ArsR/SmtB family transcription factor [Alkalihalobacillus sp. MEB130]
MAKEKQQQTETCEVFLYDEQVVGKVKEQIAHQRFDLLADMFKVLADETRVKIAYALCQETELCVCDVASIIGTTNATASHHLRHLKNLRIAKSEKRGKLVFYSLDDEHIRTLLLTAIAHQNEEVSK